MAVTYEWTVEEIDEHGDANAVHFADDLADACKLRDHVRGECHKVMVGLVRHEHSEAEGETARFYAYVDDNGRLPGVFSSCSDEADGPQVPAKFQAQINRLGALGLIPHVPA